MYHILKSGHAVEMFDVEDMDEDGLGNLYVKYEELKKNQYGQYLKDVIDGKYQENLY